MTSKSLLTHAVERKAWDVVALCLLVGVAEVASRLPPETLEELVSLLEVPDRHAKRKG